jgi:mannose-1-phosphate guanylyltransferase/phosphomannomutase
VSEQVARFHRVGIHWTATSPDALAAAATDPNLILGADGRGGFVVPESSGNIDGIAAFLHLVGLVARTQLQLSEIDARIPQAHMAHRSLQTPWAAKGAVMRTVVEAASAGDRRVDTVDGVRVVEPDGSWTLVIPDPTEPVTHLWTEAQDDEAAEALLEVWTRIVERDR